MAESVKHATRLVDKSPCNYSKLTDDEEETEMNRNVSKKPTKPPSELPSKDSVEGKSADKATQYAPLPRLSIRELVFGKNTKKVPERAPKEEPIESLDLRATVDTVADMINKKQMPFSAMRDIVLPWYEKQQQRQGACLSQKVLAQAMVSKLPAKQRKTFAEMYERNLWKQRLESEQFLPLPNFFTDPRAPKIDFDKKLENAQAQAKMGTIRVRDEKELLIANSIIKERIIPVQIAKDTNDFVRMLKEGLCGDPNIDKQKEKIIPTENIIKEKPPIKVTSENIPTQTVIKSKATKELKIAEICRNTINLLKFQRTHSVTYMHDIFPFLRAIYKEYKCKNMSSMTAHEFLILDQIAYNVDIYWEISKTEKLYKETLLDGHIFLSRHITKLLESFLQILYTKSKDKDNEDCGNFIILMDVAFERIYEIDLDRNKKEINLEICEEVLNIVKEILCTAYSIALVCDEYDSKSIKGSSKTVLDDLAAVKTEIELMRNISMCNLLVDSFCDNLCALERKVNTAVLRLTVETFSGCEDGINDLYFQCTDNKLTEKHKECIDACVGRVDNEIDKIMQIGWFAISCSGYSKYSRNLRSALATIEALEDELVPGLVTMKKRANETYIEMVLVRMLDAIKEMKKALFNIMDPHAFCLIVEGQVEKIVVDFKDQIGRNMLQFENYNRNIRRYVFMIQDMIDLSTETDPQSFQTRQLEAIANVHNDIKKVLDEIKNRLEKLFLQPDNLDLQLKMLKRFKVLRHELAKQIKLAYCYENDDHDNKAVVQNNTKVEEIIKQNDEITKATNKTLHSVEEDAQKMIRNRSIINNTPFKYKSLNRCKNADSSKLMQLLKFDEKRILNHFLSFNEKHYNEELEVTTVLQKICNKSKY